MSNSSLFHACFRRSQNSETVSGHIKYIDGLSDLPGGYAFAKLTEQEEIKVSLGVPQIFLGNIGRLNEARFTRYYCNRCKKYTGYPVITSENPNKKLGENIT